MCAIRKEGAEEMNPPPTTFLARVLAAALFMTLAGCGAKVDESLVGKWIGVEKNQDLEFLADGTFYAYKPGKSEPDFEGTYSIEDENIMAMTRDTETHKVAYHVSDDGEMLSYAFTQDMRGRPVAKENLYMIILLRDKEAE